MIPDQGHCSFCFTRSSQLNPTYPNLLVFIDLNTPAALLNTTHYHIPCVYFCCCLFHLKYNARVREEQNIVLPVQSITISSGNTEQQNAFYLMLLGKCREAVRDILSCLLSPSPLSLSLSRSLSLSLSFLSIISWEQTNLIPLFLRVNSCPNLRVLHKQCCCLFSHELALTKMNPVFAQEEKTTFSFFRGTVCHLIWSDAKKVKMWFIWRLFLAQSTLGGNRSSAMRVIR